MSGAFPGLGPALSNEDEVSCSMTQQHTPGEIRIRDHAVKSMALYKLS